MKPAQKYMKILQSIRRFIHFYMQLHFIWFIVLKRCCNSHSSWKLIRDSVCRVLDASGEETKNDELRNIRFYATPKVPFHPVLKINLQKFWASEPEKKLGPKKFGTFSRKIIRKSERMATCLVSRCQSYLNLFFVAPLAILYIGWHNEQPKIVFDRTDTSIKCQNNKIYILGCSTVSTMKCGKRATSKCVCVWLKRNSFSNRF